MLLTLKSRQQNDQARDKLEARQCSALDLGVGDRFKSWDLELAISVIDQYLGPEATVLDIGAFCSEMCPSLSLLGYRNLYAVDLNNKILQQPMNDKIHYAVGDFYHTAAVNSSFDAVTAISVIEHGYDPESVFVEIARILKPGGLFVASYDYWPVKIPTDHVVSFGMPWIIFDRHDVDHMVSTAAKHGLTLLTKDRDLEAGEPHIRYNGFNYTFGFAVFRRQ